MPRSVAVSAGNSPSPRGSRVSVVIPTYNRAHIVGEAVESVLRQTFTDFEMVVVDDGSKDATAQEIGRFRDSRLRYVRQERNRGVAAARNRGVAETQAAFVSFLDSDDLWKPGKLDAEVAFLDAHPEIDAVFSDLERYEGAAFTPSFMRQTAVFARRLAGRSYPDGLLLTQREMLLCLLQEVPIKPAALTMRRAAFERVSGFDETWSSSEDWEFFLRLAEAARFAYIDRPLAVLRISADSLHRTDQEWGHRAILGLLARRLPRFRGDREAVAAIRRGIGDYSKHLSWYYLGQGRRREAFQNYLTGFRQTLHPELALRAAAVWLPEAVLESVKRLARVPRPGGRRANVPGHP